jgi:hypothetical protein
VSQLDARAWEIRERVVNKLRTNPSQKRMDKIWEATMKDRDAGYCRGPFTHQQQVSQELEDQDWIPTPRFPREQKEKVRPIDDCKDILINAASKVTEWLELASTDRNVGFIKKLHQKLAAKYGPEKAKTMIAGWVLDEADAYRQIGVNPSQRKYAVIALVNPQTGEVNYFLMTGHSFGSHSGQSERIRPGNGRDPENATTATWTSCKAEREVNVCCLTVAGESWSRFPEGPVREAVLQRKEDRTEPGHKRRAGSLEEPAQSSTKEEARAGRKRPGGLGDFHRRLLP